MYNLLNFSQVLCCYELFCLLTDSLIIIDCEAIIICSFSDYPQVIEDVMINKKKLESYPREDLGLGRRQILTNNHTHRATYMTYDRGK